MKKFFKKVRDSFVSLPVKARRLLSLGLVMAFTLALPLFVWGILTGNFDIRKRAATGEPPTPTPTPTVVCKTGVNAWSSGTSCKLISGEQGLMYARYQCHDSETWYTASLGRCATHNELSAISTKFCANRSNCPTPIPTLTPRPSLSPSPTVSASPTPTPTPTPTPLPNRVPVFTTKSLPPAFVYRRYSAKITGYDLDLYDNLFLSVGKLPQGLRLGDCTTTITPHGTSGQQRRQITCTVSGIPLKAGRFTITPVLSDGRGGMVSKTLNLWIFKIPFSKPGLGELTE